MHQQVRTTTTKTGSRSPGPGAKADQGGLADILEVLSEGGFNLQAAGGHDLGRGGEFVFAVHHEDGDDTQARLAADLLKKHGYQKARPVDEVFHRHVGDTPGALLDCIREAEDAQGPTNEIFVGTPDAEGSIPIQVTAGR